MAPRATRLVHVHHRQTNPGQPIESETWKVPTSAMLANLVLWTRETSLKSPNGYWCWTAAAHQARPARQPSAVSASEFAFLDVVLHSGLLNVGAAQERAHTSHTRRSERLAAACPRVCRNPRRGATTGKQSPRVARLSLHLRRCHQCGKEKHH